LAQDGIDTIEVIGTTPLGAKSDSGGIAGNVQSASAAELAASGATDLADFMRRAFVSVHVNEAQSNPLQADLQYRGFVASPLLGLPQGLAVYQDGVRLNDPFGDTVNWALVPQSAIDTVYLMPGSNPLFGLNALGGAIAIETKNGETSPGTRAKVTAGSFERVAVQAETGGGTERTSYFATVEHLDEDGWRDYSPTEATQAFASVRTEANFATLEASVTYADADLIGNGAAPVELLERERRAVFTRPDRTRNEMLLVNVTGERRLSERLELAGNAYWRDGDTDTYNGDDSDFEPCDAVPAFVCEAEDDDEEIVLDAAGEPIPADDAVLGATVNRTATRQRSRGAALQASWRSESAAAIPRQSTAGMSYDEGDIDFRSSTELGRLDMTRQALPGGRFVGESFVALDAATRNTGAFATTTLTPRPNVAVTLAGRYNRTTVVLDDRLGTALNGRHTFERFNPAIGATFDLGGGTTFYASYSEASRAPSPVELTCADEDDPCRLPNAFVADPPLEQVVASTFETGLRGGGRGDWRWRVALFRTVNDDDILFISAGALTNEGYFDNVGKTRRDGIEVSVDGSAGERTTWFLGATHLDATFRESFAVASPNHPNALDSEIAVQPGDRLPLIPRGLLKGGIDVELGPAFSVGANLLASGGQHVRGDEGNDADAIDGYAIVNLHASFRVTESLSVFLNVDNVFDRDYETFGVFGEADEVLGDDFEDPLFLGPGAPRAAWLGVRLRL
jgi:outer membrane receptor protein involved in Fe transport